jgi:hypothetical protein
MKFIKRLSEKKKKLDLQRRGDHPATVVLIHLKGLLIILRKRMLKETLLKSWKSSIKKKFTPMTFKCLKLS